jgi:glycyl-tRNA synthetase
LAHLCKAYDEETVTTGSGGEEIRTVLRLHPLVAPVKVAVFPLVKKDGLPELAKTIIDDLKFDMQVTYDEKDAVGRRYRRQDAKGTPWCITVDNESLEDGQVTIRERDSMQQERVSISELRGWFKDKLDLRHYLGAK